MNQLGLAHLLFLLWDNHSHLHKTSCIPFMSPWSLGGVLDLAVFLGSYSSFLIQTAFLRQNSGLWLEFLWQQVGRCVRIFGGRKRRRMLFDLDWGLRGTNLKAPGHEGLFEEFLQNGVAGCLFIYGFQWSPVSFAFPFLPKILLKENSNSEA